ncbi:MAG: hypothetical protein MI923_16065 [Phycisphaerales bacterium]|nr:hypothetical protein [Phycisphaerales bacterium]
MAKQTEMPWGNTEAIAIPLEDIPRWRGTRDNRVIRPGYLAVRFDLRDDPRYSVLLETAHNRGVLGEYAVMALVMIAGYSLTLQCPGILAHEGKPMRTAQILSFWHFEHVGIDQLNKAISLLLDTGWLTRCDPNETELVTAYCENFGRRPPENSSPRRAMALHGAPTDGRRRTKTDSRRTTTDGCHGAPRRTVRIGNPQLVELAKIAGLDSSLVAADLLQSKGFERRDAERLAGKVQAELGPERAAEQTLIALINVRHLEGAGKLRGSRNGYVAEAIRGRYTLLSTAEQELGQRARRRASNAQRRARDKERASADAEHREYLEGLPAAERRRLKTEVRNLFTTELHSRFPDHDEQFERFLLFAHAHGQNVCQIYRDAISHRHAR